MRTKASWPYAILALLIFGPLLSYGYILTLDMIFMPKLHYPTGLDNLLPFHALLNAINVVIPGWVIQKLLLLSVFFAAGVGMHRLVPTKNEWARYAAGTLYVINPFTYSRLMSGQYLVLAGYALMPWFVRALIAFVQKPERGSALRLAGWTVGIGFLSIHYLGFAMLMGLVVLVVAGWREHKHSERLKKLVGWGALAAAGVLLANSFWLVPTLAGHSSQSELIGQFDQRHLLTFRTDPAPIIGVPGNVLAMSGMWTDREGLYLNPRRAAWYWPALLVVILAFAGLGAVKYWRDQRLLILIIGTTGLIAWVLAQGIVGTPFAWLNGWLYSHLPFFSGYREPGKFTGLVVLAECLLFGLGVAWLLERIAHKDWAKMLAPLILALPLLYTPTLLWGAAGQLKAVDYPADWYALGRSLDADIHAGKVLFLPWHQYMYFDFAGRLIANPASRFFDAQVIQGDNSEIGLIERQTANSTSATIESQVLSRDHKEAAQALKSLGITHVVLAKEADYKEYGWLDTRSGIKLDSDTATLRVYEVK